MARRILATFAPRLRAARHEWKEIPYCVPRARLKSSDHTLTLPISSEQLLYHVIRCCIRPDATCSVIHRHPIQGGDVVV